MTEAQLHELIDDAGDMDEWYVMHIADTFTKEKEVRQLEDYVNYHPEPLSTNRLILLLRNTKVDLKKLSTELNKLFPDKEKDDLVNGLLWDVVQNTCYWDEDGKTWDTQALSTAKDACEELVKAGELVRVSEGYGRRQFYKEVSA